MKKLFFLADFEDCSEDVAESDVLYFRYLRDQRSDLRIFARNIFALLCFGFYSNYILLFRRGGNAIFSNKSHQFLIIVIMFCFLPGLHAQNSNRLTREEYIELYKDIAIKEMNRSGIPASITLAQGCLESDNGNSRLAVKANNHFGIKCHDWKGKKIYHDDDERHECFRKYKSAGESYADHTEFLMNTPRYSSLFLLAPDDYFGWAKGLRRAGYATSPTYAEALIRVIEENKLYIYDKPGKEQRRRQKDEVDLADVDHFTIEMPGRKILTRNRISFIIVKDGDTYQSLTSELDMMPFELAKYNEIPRDSKLEPGQVLYLQPKRKRASVEFRFHTVENGETMYQISQMYGIRLKKLYQMNLMEEGTEPDEGTVLNLRKKKKPEEVGEEEESPQVFKSTSLQVLKSSSAEKQVLEGLMFFEHPRNGKEIEDFCHFGICK